MTAQQQKFDVAINSEVGELEGVILHTPGQEIENMTPQNAERALYSDILNLSVASLEYAQLRGVLDKVTRTFQVKSLLEQVLRDAEAKRYLVDSVCVNEDAEDIREELMGMSGKDLCRCFLEGVLMKKDNLSRFLDHEKYSLRPLHNFFFTRDSAIAINDWVLISRMASKVRTRESLIMEAIFRFHPMFGVETLNPNTPNEARRGVQLEGGDILVARHDILLVGIGARTNPNGVDFLVEHFRKRKQPQHILVQELPLQPESFIHLDMVFTFVDTGTCMIYEPVIMQPNRYRTVRISIDNGKTVRITEEKNLPDALKILGMPLDLIQCGASSDPWTQEREQWHSGANFFAIGPGRIIGYRRNINTIEELDRKGFAIIDATDVAQGKVDLSRYGRCVITIDGSELARGGGGCRCMTMPIRRRGP